MPKSYTPYGAANPVDNLAALNDVFQEKEDYFLGVLGVGQNVQQRVSGTAGETLADRAAAYLNLADNEIYLMDSDASGPRAGILRGFVDGGALPGADATLVISGLMDGFAGLTGYSPVYVGTTAGSITQTRPIATLDGNQIMIAEMGFSVGTDTVFVRPRPIQYHLRAAFSDNETKTIVHHADAEGYTRKVLAYMTTHVTGAVAATYASSNQDSDVPLAHEYVATYSSDLCTGGTASASDTNGAATADLAFDNSAVSSRWQGDLGSGVWLKYDLGSGNNKIIRKYTLQALISGAGAFAPTAWTFEASNDNSSWTVLDTVSGEAAWSGGELRSYEFLNTTAWRYLRWVFTASVGGTVVDVAEAQLMEATALKDYPKLMQTFNLAGSATIGEIDLWLKKVGSPAGVATVRIETVSGGNPTGTLADANATATFDESDLSTGYAAKTVIFSPYTLSSGDYAIVISTSRASDDDDYIVWGADGSSPAYAGGVMKGYDGAAWQAESKDAIFTLRDVTVYHPGWMKVGWWGTSHADLVNRYGDGSGADENTKTTFKNLLDAGFDDATLVVELN
jgi:hypothetical protein